MTDKCWLASCGGLYRTSMVDVRAFAGLPRFLEWTYLGLKLASTRRMFFLDQPTFRVHDSEDSLSKSVDIGLGQLRRYKLHLSCRFRAESPTDCAHDFRRPTMSSRETI